MNNADKIYIPWFLLLAYICENFLSSTETVP